MAAGTLQLMMSHRYYTESAKATRDATKAENMQNIIKADRGIDGMPEGIGGSASLCCSECDVPLGRSNSLPGREGCMAHPTIIGMAYDPANTNGRFITYEPTFIESHRSIAICLACLEKRLPRQMRSMLQRIYKAYEIEMALAQQTNNERGRWLRHDYEPEFTWEMLAKRAQVHTARMHLYRKGMEKDRPFFTLRMIDRVNSTLEWVSHRREGNYQVTVALRGVELRSWSLSTPFRSSSACNLGTWMPA